MFGRIPELLEVQVGRPTGPRVHVWFGFNFVTMHRVVIRHNSPGMYGPGLGPGKVNSFLFSQPRTLDLLHRGKDNQQSYSQNLRMSADSLLSRDERWYLTLREVLRSLAASRIHPSQRQIPHLLRAQALGFDMRYAGFLSSTGRGAMTPCKYLRRSCDIIYWFPPKSDQE